jgi:hypothetical protein
VTYSDSTAAEGTNSYYVTALNAGGESGGSNVIETIVDRTVPTIDYSISPAANSSGWNITTTVVTFHCSDGLSGINTCPQPVTVSSEGAVQHVTGTATDRAGNTASVTVMISLDKTAPVITHTLSAQPNSDGWNNGPITVSFNCTDALSGMAYCSVPQTYSNDGSYSVAGYASDIASNQSEDDVYVRVDQTVPTITYSVSPALNANGWSNSSEVVSFTCSDSMSGVKT